MTIEALTVTAGEHGRENCPVWLDVAPGAVPAPYGVFEDEAGRRIPYQTTTAGPPRLCIILPRLLRGESTTFRLVATDVDPDVTVALNRVRDGQIDVSVAGSLFTTYHYGSGWARPFLMPVIGPFGAPVTRHYPVESRDGETSDHPHHKSVWVAWGDVNGSDNWSEQHGHARQEHQRFESVESGPVFGRIAAVNDWVTDEGEKLLEEHRTLTFYNLPDTGRFIDLKVVFRATEGPVTFGDTKEGGIASVRVATSMDASGAGSIRNSYGGTNEAETWGKKAHWCDYVGPVDGQTVGITVFDTPGNFRYPTTWHVRNYGLMTANPFGLSYFLCDKAADGSHTIGRDAVFPFAYRLYIHAGDTDAADVAGKFLDYVAPPGCAPTSPPVRACGTPGTTGG